MGTPVLPDYVAPFKPVPNVTPFTYRDGITMLKKLTGVIKYLNLTIVPFINTNFTDLGDAFEEQVNILIDQVNAAIAAVINESVEVQDAVVAGIVTDPGSDTRIALDGVFATVSALASTIDEVDIIQTDLATRLSDATLDAKYLNNVSATKKYGRVLRPEMFGAVGDGVTDDSAAFTAITNALQDGDRVVGDSSKVYAFFTPIEIANVSFIQWEGGQYKFTRNTASVSGAIIAFKLDNVNDSLIENIYIEQFNQTPQYTGISVNNSNNVRLNNVSAHNFRWVGIAVAPTAKNVEVFECKATRCRFGGFSTAVGTKFIGGRFSSEWSKTQEFIDKGGVWDETSLYYDGIIIGGTDWSVIGVTFDDNGQSGIYGGDVKRGTIIGCYVAENWNKGIDLGTVEVADAINRITISDNVIIGNKTGNISLAGVADSIVIGNVIESHGDTFAIGVHSKSINNIIIANNVTSDSETSAAVFVEAVTVPVASGNIIKDNNVGAVVQYSVDRSQNIVEYRVGNNTMHQSVFNIDRSTLTGFSGRVGLVFNFSADNTFGQVITNKPIAFTDGGGTNQRIDVGGIESTRPILTQRGNTASRPTAATAGSGAMYYDNQIGKPIWSDGASWRDATGAVV